MCCNKPPLLILYVVLSFLEFASPPNISFCVPWKKSLTDVESYDEQKMIHFYFYVGRAVSLIQTKL